ncbi:MAG: DUF4230 domain-containing protein [Prevotella sp.]|nr:DUF4230 domain-containing protein [Prevotella sp.]
MKILTYIKIGIGVVVVVLLVAGFFWLRGLTKDDDIDFGTDTAIGITPTQIQSIKAIGEWEFLAVSAEELVDTVRKGLLMNDELARIYYGTLRLGINMHQVKPGWMEVRGDSVTMVLPAIGLLDKDFIDEARTKSFYESGSWKSADREALYKKAYRMMRRHCMTNENLRAAEANGEEQFRNMLRSMGYKHVRITFEH